jgi:uncharacterized protein (DUF2062 family)
MKLFLTFEKTMLSRMIKFRPLSMIKKLGGFLRQGTSPKALAISTTIGLLLGVFPMLGVTTLVMTAISLRYRLNLPLMITVSYLIYPFQILLFIPFIRFGEWMSGSTPIILTLDSLKRSFQDNFFAALQDLGTANLLAVAGWTALALPAGLMMYGMLVPAFQYIVRRNERNNLV